MSRILAISCFLAIALPSTPGLAQAPEIERMREVMARADLK